VSSECGEDADCDARTQQHQLAPAPVGDPPPNRRRERGYKGGDAVEDARHKLTALAVSTPSPGSNKGMIGLNAEKAPVMMN
jgi:hypothetical protein